MRAVRFRMSWPAVTALVSCMTYGLGVLTALPTEPPPVRTTRPVVSFPAAHEPRPHVDIAWLASAAPIPPAAPAPTPDSDSASPSVPDPVSVSASAPPPPLPPPVLDDGSLRAGLTLDVPPGHDRDGVQRQVLLALAEALARQSQPRAAFSLLESALALKSDQATIDECLRRDPERTLVWLERRSMSAPRDKEAARVYFEALNYRASWDDPRITPLIERMLAIDPEWAEPLELLCRRDPEAILRRAPRLVDRDRAFRLTVNALTQLGRIDEALALVLPTCGDDPQAKASLLVNYRPQVAEPDVLALRNARPDDWDAIEVHLRMLVYLERWGEVPSILRSVLRSQRSPELLLKLAEWVHEHRDYEMLAEAMEALGPEALAALDAVAPITPGTPLWEGDLVRELDPDRFLRVILAQVTREARNEAPVILARLSPQRLQAWLPRLPADRDLWCDLIAQLDADERPDLAKQVMGRALLVYPEDATVAELVRERTR